MPVLIPFARHIQTQKVVSIDEVDKGLACNCICLYCQTPLVANKGTEKIHHFSHKAKESNDENACPISYERSVLWMVRQILEESNTLRTPGATLERQSLIYGSNKIEAVQSKLTRYEAIEFPEGIHKENKDAALLNIQGHRLYLTVSFSTVNLKYLEYLPAVVDGIEYPHLHISLMGLKNKLLGESNHFKDTLTQLLINETSQKTWLYHPKMEKVFNEFIKKDEQEKYLYREQKKAHYSKMDSNNSLPTVSSHRLVPPNLTNVASNTSFNEHLKELIQSAVNYYKSGVKKVKQCNKCYFIMSPTALICGSCSSREFNHILLTDNFMRNIETIYKNEGLAEKSYVHIYKCS